MPQDHGPLDDLLKERVDLLLAKRTLLVEGKLSHDDWGRLKRLVHALDLKGADPITLLIDSDGGAIEGALEFYHFVRAEIRSPLIGKVNGKCASAAVVALQGCGERLATRNSWFLLHNPYLETTFLADNKEFRYGKDFEKKFAALERVLSGHQRGTEYVLAQRSRHTIAEVRRWLHRGDSALEILRSPEALRRRLIDRIL